jgi:putative SOS response-associated peptidase YedK
MNGRSWMQKQSSHSRLRSSRESRTPSPAYGRDGRIAARTDLLTFTVIMTDPNEVVQPLHDRMPVIIPEKDYGRWLQSGDPDRPPIDVLRPFERGQDDCLEGG